MNAYEISLKMMKNGKKKIKKEGKKIVGGGARLDIV